MYPIKIPLKPLKSSGQMGGICRISKKEDVEVLPEPEGNQPDGRHEAGDIRVGPWWWIGCGE